MISRWLVVVLLSGVLLAGCAAKDRTRRDGQVQSKDSPGRAADRVVKSPDGQNSSGADVSEAGNGADAAAAENMTPVHELSINGYSVQAEDILKQLKDDLSAKAKTMPPDRYQEYAVRRAASAITDKIGQVLLLQRGSLRLSERENEMVDKFVDQQLKRIIATKHGGVEWQYKQHLEAEGRTLEDVWQDLRREIIIARHLELKIRPLVPEPTRDEMLAIFEANADSWRKPMRRSMSLIDIRIDGDSGKARQRIEAARNRIVAGEPFADVAKEVSDGFNAPDGGRWGWVTADGVKEVFRPAVEALDKLSSGEMSQIIEADKRFFLVRCDELDPGAEPDFQQLQPQLRESYSQMAFNRLIAEEIAKLREEAVIEPANLDRFLVGVLQIAPQPGGIQ